LGFGESQRLETIVHRKAVKGIQMSHFDLEALKAAAESHSLKTESGFSGTDVFSANGMADAAQATALPHLDLSTTYMGLKLRNPLVVSASPLSQSVSQIVDLANAGAGAVVLYSLFEEQLAAEAEAEEDLEEDSQGENPEADDGYFPIEDTAEQKLNQYLDLITAASKAVDIPIIASLNGSTQGGWTEIAAKMEKAGAAGIELNIYFVPGDLDVTGQQVEDRHIEILSDVKQAVSIPVAVKIGPYFSSTGNMIKRLDQAGADAVVLFNRFFQPDIDLDGPKVVAGFAPSHQYEAALPRTWISSMFHHVKASLAGSTGVETPDDVIKYLMAGADVVMTTSALLKHGPIYLSHLLGGLKAYLEDGGLTLDQLRGELAMPADTDPDKFNRTGYVAAIENAKRRFNR
jgi:dihydroorotate dehydrogenase (fumarate)